jgi:hypothetical protein
MKERLVSFLVILRRHVVAVWWKILELVLSRITLISRGVGHVDVAY